MVSRGMYCGGGGGTCVLFMLLYHSYRTHAASGLRPERPRFADVAQRSAINSQAPRARCAGCTPTPRVTELMN
eukprot:7978706-Pyramimonas_sp.AAC.1